MKLRLLAIDQFRATAGEHKGKLAAGLFVDATPEQDAEIRRALAAGDRLFVTVEVPPLHAADPVWFNHVGIPRTSTPMARWVTKFISTPSSLVRGWWYWNQPRTACRGPFESEAAARSDLDVYLGDVAAREPGSTPTQDEP